MESPHKEPIVVHHHYYIPMPIFEAWIKSQKGNFQMVKFNTVVPQELISKGFTSPTKENVDNELINQFRQMNIGDALLIPFDTSMSERSLKVQVGKAASAAGRKVEWNKGKLEEGYVVRVKLIVNNGTSNNGVVTPTEEAATEEAPASRNRR
jgi:hypothetical protein